MRLYIIHINIYTHTDTHTKSEIHFLSMDITSTYVDGLWTSGNLFMVVPYILHETENLCDVSLNNVKNKTQRDFLADMSNRFFL